ncbi:hypothetical protein IA54_015570 [Xanthomonas phaseoli pv. syngonii LMG 9055]|uniref:Uncharacterized protein n=1 Tax=Xanthomonas phaseoli pv. syngonii LMG 9055 TaxID=1437878 RepID=A0A1V9GKC9_9XANT|nr:hypothetical protein IA54_015570 [Xanthomonas phaseoli pv. syngonii LMG 9055]
MRGVHQRIEQITALRTAVAGRLVCQRVLVSIVKMICCTACGLVNVTYRSQHRIGQHSKQQHRERGEAEQATKLAGYAVHDGEENTRLIVR